jgi:hypothetical protein
MRCDAELLTHHHTAKRTVLATERWYGGLQGAGTDIATTSCVGASRKSKENLDVGVYSRSLGPIVPSIEVEATSFNRAIVVVYNNF